jgi:hypothetical protein
VTLASLRRLVLLLSAVTLLLGIAASGASAFEVTDFDGLLTNKDGSATTQAGSHPYQITAGFDVNTVERPNGEIVPEESTKGIKVELPPGLIGDPTALPKCSLEDLEGAGALAECPADTQVGVATVRFGLLGLVNDSNFNLFNVQPRPGVPAEFGFNFLSVPILLKATVRTGADYGLNLELSNAPQGLALIGSKLTFWGVPGDPAHTRERGFDRNGFECSNPHSDPASCNHEVDPPIKPFLTMPATCPEAPLETTLHLDSWQHPGLDHSATFLSHDGAARPSPVVVDRCGDPRLALRPKLTIKPTTSEARSASGLEVDLQLPQKAVPPAVSDLYPDSDSDAALATPPLHTAVVRLPAGLTLNPAVASGLAACANAEIELAGSGPGRCPEGSKIGAAEVRTPLLDHPLRGGVYIARQRENKFGSLLAVYIGLTDPTGVVVKLAGRVDVNGATGQLTARFDENPQLPFSELRLDFFGGSGGAFITPETCGTFEGRGEFSSWSAVDPAHPTAEETTTATASFAIDRGPSGQPCGAAGFSPALSAGTASAAAGQYSPLLVRVSRADGTQQLSSVVARFPKGLLAKLAGIPYCPETKLASVSTAEGAAAAELAAPSCPQQSQVGTVSVGAGAGSPLFVNSGKVYLAGPYKGAPLSLGVIVPALAGPFDLGNVAVRVALRVDPEGAQITAVSDPLPTILHGIPLDIRSLALDVNRSQFILNPTNCTPSSVDPTVAAVGGATASLSQRFQIGGCDRLVFRPKLSLRLHGGVKRAALPALSAVLADPAGPGFANPASASVTLPVGQILEQAHLKSVCTQVQFAAGQCPPTSIYGFAKAVSPLLDQPLEGPVYLRANGGARPLPDLVADLNGQIRIDVVGVIDSPHQRLRTRFLNIPDAPVSQFSLSFKGAAKGLLVNSTQLCGKVHKATAVLSAQNGAAESSLPVVANDCKKKKKRHRAR